jgi:hypothetical protein
MPPYATCLHVNHPATLTSPAEKRKETLTPFAKKNLNSNTTKKGEKPWILMLGVILLGALANPKLYIKNESYHCQKRLLD